MSTGSPARLNRAALAAVVASALLLVGCKDLPKGASTTYSTKEYADDGDDNNGAPASESFPNSSAFDGGTLAVSHPISFSQFFAIADARTGPKANRQASTDSSGETISYFDVNPLFGKTSIELKLHTIMTSSIATGSSSIDTSLALGAMPGGTLVVPLQQFIYVLAPNKADPSQVDIKLNGNLLTTIPSGGRYEDVRTFSAAFDKGKYKFDLTWQAISVADGKVNLTAYSYVEAK